MTDPARRPRSWDSPSDSLRRAVDELPPRDVLRAAAARTMAAVGRLQEELGPEAELHPDQRPLTEWYAIAMRHMAAAVTVTGMPVAKAACQAEIAYASAALMMALESRHRQDGYQYLPEEE